MQRRIAILGWGSLIWDTRPDFDEWHTEWQEDGPALPLEFSRVSESRENALTLVLDEASGRSCRVAYALSKRKNADDAITDLRCREGTTLRNIGIYFLDGSRQNSRLRSVTGQIATWANEKSIDVVIWTDLASNFESKSYNKRQFSVAEAIEHLHSLPIYRQSKGGRIHPTRTRFCLYATTRLHSSHTFVPRARLTGVQAVPASPTRLAQASARVAKMYTQ